MKGNFNKFIWELIWAIIFFLKNKNNLKIIDRIILIKIKNNLIKIK